MQICNICFGSQENKSHPGVHQVQHKQLVKSSSYPSVFSVVTASLCILSAVLGITEET